MGDSLLFLGTSDGRSCRRRAHSSAVLEFGGSRVLLDCGEPCSRPLCDLGLMPHGIEAIFLSHLHSDHVGGLPMLVQNFWLEKRRRPLPLFMPREGIAPLRAWLHTCYLCECMLPFRLDARPWKAGRPFRWHGLRVLPVRNRHLQGFRKLCHCPGIYESLSFRIEAGARSLVWSADIAAPEDLDRLLEKPTGTLVCELAHFPPESLFHFLAGKKFGQLVLTHFGSGVVDDLARVRRVAAKALPGRRVLFARDGLRVKL